MLSIANHGKAATMLFSHTGLINRGYHYALSNEGERDESEGMQAHDRSLTSVCVTQTSAA